MLNLVKYTLKASSRILTISRFPYVFFNTEISEHQAKDHVTSTIMDTLKAMDKCNVQKLNDKAKFFCKI